MITVVQPEEPFASDPTLLLALVIWREARGESLDAKIGVARTVINRCHTRGQGFAADISGNVLKPGAFSSFNEGDPNATKYPEHDDPSWRDSLKAAHDAGASDPILGDAFIQGDALRPSVDLRAFDFIWASPPCQAHSTMKTMPDAKPHPDLIEAARSLLVSAGKPYCIENVPGAPLRTAFQLCGTAFGLGVEDAELRRHRWFEASFLVLSPRCQHTAHRVIGIYGEGARDSRRKYNKSIPEWTVRHARQAMQSEWMTISEICESIPPAYAQFIGEQAVAYIRSKAA